MRLLVLLVLAGCATHDALHSEPLVARAACTDDGTGIFGRIDDIPTCGAQVTSLGDGCYLAMRDGPHLYECAAASPDGHVMCVDDRAGATWTSSDCGDPIEQVVTVKLASEPFPATVRPGRCRQRYEDYRIATDPPVVAVAHLEDWRRHDSHDDIGRRIEIGVNGFNTGESTVSFRRIMGCLDRLEATVCPTTAGARVALAEELPARFAHRVSEFVAFLLAFNQVVPEQCTRFSFRITGEE